MLMGFNSEERVRKGAEKLSKFLNAKQQGRLDGFFTVQQKTSPEKGGKNVAAKGKEKKGEKRKVRHFLLVMSIRRPYTSHDAGG